MKKKKRKEKKGKRKDYYQKGQYRNCLLGFDQLKKIAKIFELTKLIQYRVTVRANTFERVFEKSEMSRRITLSNKKIFEKFEKKKKKKKKKF